MFGAVLMVIYYIVCWSPEIGAALIRRKEHQRFEAEIAETLQQQQDNERPDSGSSP